jgi:hypothetical protein
VYNPLPNGPLTPTGVNRLKRLVSKNRKNWTDYEKEIAERALPTLKQGAVSHMCSILPAIRTKSNFSAAQNEKQTTDTTAFWVSQKYVSGPFNIPPLTELRVNPLMAAVPPEISGQF